MITPSGTVELSKKKGKAIQASRKKKVRDQKGKEKAIDLEGKLQRKVREREDRKVSHQVGIRLTNYEPYLTFYKLILWNRRND